jgi:hypothetical protein
MKLVPERDELFRAIPEIRERLRLNVELASPVDFLRLVRIKAVRA